MEAVSGSPLAASRSSALEELLLAAVDTELKWMFIPGGQILFRENEVADSLYIVLIAASLCGTTTAATFWSRDMLAISDRRR